MDCIKSFLLCDWCICIYRNKWFNNRKDGKTTLLEDTETTVYFQDIYFK